MANNYGEIVSDLLKPIPWEEQDRWLAQAVVDLVGERKGTIGADYQYAITPEEATTKALGQLEIVPADYAELKRRVGK